MDENSFQIWKRNEREFDENINRAIKINNLFAGQVAKQTATSTCTAETGVLTIEKIQKIAKTLEDLGPFPIKMRVSPRTVNFIKRNVSKAPEFHGALFPTGLLVEEDCELPEGLVVIEMSDKTKKVIWI